MYAAGELESNGANFITGTHMPLQAYKSIMYVGCIMTAASVVAVAVDVGLIGVVLFCTGVLTLLAGAVGYLWNGD